MPNISQIAILAVNEPNHAKVPPLYTFHSIDGFTVVTGYPDGKDWIFEGTGRSGIVSFGNDLLWQIASDGTFRMYDITERSERFRLKIGISDLSGSLAVPDRDGQFIFLICPLPPIKGSPNTSKIVKIEIATGTIQDECDGPVGGTRSAVIMDDGALLLSTIGRRNETPASILTRIDPSDLSAEESILETPIVPLRHGGTHWITNSPDGKYWFRQDHTSIPIEKRSAGPGQPERVYYGLVLQMWSAFPLKFEKRIIIAWLKVEELPDETFILSNIQKRSAQKKSTDASRSKSGFSNLRTKVFGQKKTGTIVQPNTPNLANSSMLASVPERDRLWTSMALSIEAAVLNPGDPFAERLNFGTEVQSNDDLWDGMTRNLEKFYQSAFTHPIGWQEDNVAFWIARSGFLICIGIDGTVSPRLWSERVGFKTMAIPFANKVHQKEILANRQLRGIMLPSKYADIVEGGTLLFDGAGTDNRFEPRMISHEEDRWIEGANAMPETTINEQKYKQKIKKIRKNRSIVRVPLGSMENADRVEAISGLIQLIDEDFPNRAYDHQIDVAFELDDAPIPEYEFFDNIQDSDRDWALPALQSLIGKYVAVSNPGKETVYSSAENGECLFGHAVLRLGQLDQSSLPLIQKYGQLMDGGHEYYFPSKIVPSLIKVHGWTDEMIDFGFWVILFSFYNSYDQPTTVWHDFGLAKALSAKSPDQLASRVANIYGPVVEAGQLKWGDLAHLKKCLGADMSQWDRDFFAAMENKVQDFAAP